MVARVLLFFLSIFPSSSLPFRIDHQWTGWTFPSFSFNKIVLDILILRGMRKSLVSARSFFVVITFVLMTFSVSKSFVQRAKLCRLSRSSGSMAHRHFSSTVDSHDVMSYLQHPPNEHEIHALSSFLAKKRNVCVITGAGVSTSSGIPDYRGPQGSYKLGHKPMVFAHSIHDQLSPLT